MSLYLISWKMCLINKFNGKRLISLLIIKSIGDNRNWNKPWNLSRLYGCMSEVMLLYIYRKSVTYHNFTLESFTCHRKSLKGGLWRNVFVWLMYFQICCRIDEIHRINSDLPKSLFISWIIMLFVAALRFCTIRWGHGSCRVI